MALDLIVMEEGESIYFVSESAAFQRQFDNGRADELNAPDGLKLVESSPGKIHFFRR